MSRTRQPGAGTPGAGTHGSEVPPASSVLAVCAHPDDESFGLGAVLHHLAGTGATVSLLCFTRGEASTLGIPEGELAVLRSAELEAGAAELGVGEVVLLDYPDGGLSGHPLDVLAREVAAVASRVGADLVVAFDQDGITGHPDHRRATEAALHAAPELPVLAWCIPRGVADALNEQFGTGFVGCSDKDVDVVLPVDRVAQYRAIACHSSQSSDNPVLFRRLELLGDSESLRWLRQPGTG